MLSLISQAKEKNSVVVIDDTYLTWLDDINFDYVHHICYISYLKYDKYTTDKVRCLDKDKGYNHVDYIEGTDNVQYIQIRYNFEYLTKQITLGDSLVIFEIDSGKLIKYSIDSWVNHEDKNDNDVFSLIELYNLYKNYCFYDLHTKFSGHESGYQYVQYEEGFNNVDDKLRKKYKLNTWKSKPTINHYRDVRVYKYFDYIQRIQGRAVSEEGCYNSESQENIQISDKLFKYRKLAFESYLFCHLMNRSIPIDYQDDWNKLGKSMYYIKIGDKNLPMFIKAEWRLDNKLISHQTWRRL